MDRIGKAFFFDLDGTLIDLDFDRLMPEYVQLLGSHFADQLPLAKFTPAFLQAAAAMLAPVPWPLPDRAPNNGERFYREFTRLTGIPSEQMSGLVDGFYTREFPTLRHLSHPIPEAPQLLAEARRRGWTIVLATQPIFPRVALLERLRWGGLPPDAFDLITSMEEFHATKPHPAYFYEVCERIGIPPQRSIMVGNDWHDDMPARLAGLHTYLAEPYALHPDAPAPTPDARGDLAHLYTLLTQGELDRWVS
ncbi:MAG: HAD family hydrolase [Limnochordaceae bacterium]|nr:HAD family hydrolase [Limnochordaceae bacterium]